MEEHSDSPTFLTAWGLPLRQIGRWAQRAVRSRRPRRLRVRETLSLGEKRFLAVIEFDRQEFLVGGSGNSFALLARRETGRVETEPPRLSVSPGLDGR